jgi:hypothetical protein
MYDYDEPMSRSEYKAERRARRAKRRAERWGYYPDEAAHLVPPNYSQAQSDNYYSPAQPPNNYMPQYSYQRAISLARQRTLLLSNAASFVMVSIFLTVAWVMSGATYFWPGWIIGLWAIGLISQATAYFIRRNLD